MKSREPFVRISKACSSSRLDAAEVVRANHTLGFLEIQIIHVPRRISAIRSVGVVVLLFDDL